MRIAAARLSPYRLPLRRPWIAASATLVERRGWLLALTGEDGLVGWGDCAPLPSSGDAGHARVGAALDQLSASLAGREAQEALDIDGPPEVRWALETALLDLEARRRGVPLARLLGAAALDVPVNAALGALDASAPERGAQALVAGYAVGKLKVGLGPIDTEIAQLHAVAEAAGGRLRLRLDANRAWRPDDARRFLAAIAALPIDAVEEPLAQPSLAALCELQRALPFALAVDESLPAFGAEALLAARAVRRLVLKPARIGGMRTTLALADRARQAGMDVVITSVVDSAVGVAAAAHLAAAIGEGPHGLATSGWLAADVAPALPVRDGCLHLADAPGLGVAPIAAA